jgi:DNA topoisomerase-2
VLEPSGNFGSRLQGGSDAASARYIYTRLSPFARRIFNAHDEPLLTYNTDDGKTIEPETYIPVVPMVLINGADGIGTGWSTSIPNYNPADVIENIRLRMAGSSKADMKPMQPWFRGWEGEVEDIGNGRFKFTGTIVHKDANTVEVTELPVRFWTQDFKAHLEEIIKAEKTPSFIKDYSEYNTPEKVHFVITLDDKGMKVALEKGLEDQFKLSRTMATTNLVAFDGQGRIHKYETPLDIMEEFYHIRLAFYEKRKQYLLNEMQRELDKLSNQSRFVQMIIDGKLVVSKKKKSVLVAELHKLNFKPIPKLADAKKQGEMEDVVEEDEDEDAAPGANDFDYLLGMAIWSLTQERVEKLLRQIGDKEAEVDALIKLSPKDLWTKDLDELTEEWHTQLQVEATRAKKSKGKGRRTSQKLGGIGNSKKRKSDDSDDDDDDDFIVSKKPKTAAKSAAASKTAPAAKSKVSKGATGLLDNFLVKPAASKPAGVFPVIDGIEQQPIEAPPAVKAGLIAPSEITKPLVKRKITKIEDSDDDMEIVAKPVAKAAVRRTKTALDTDDEDEVAPPVKAAAKPAAKPAPRKKPVIESDSGDDDVEMFDAAKMKPVAQPAAAASRGRAAAKKPIKYAADSDEEMSDDDLGDISKMVKEIPSAAPGRSLLSNSTHRIGASHGIKSSQGRKESVEPVDDTDWAELAKGTPAKPIAQATAAANFSDDEDANMDDDSILLSTRKPQPLKTISKTATKPTASTAAKAKKPAVAPAKTLSPAAKAYAAKQSKAAAAKPAAKAPASRKKTALDSEDEDEDLANDILSDDDEDETMASPAVSAARPSRRAAAAKPKAKYVLDDEDEEESEEDDFEEEEDEEEETFNEDSE